MAAPLRMLEALATPHGIDRYLELVSPLLTVRELRARVCDVERSTPDSVTLTLRPTRQWRGFRAGQFVSLTVDIDGVRRTRCYSPSCSQYRADGRIELIVKAHPDGLVSNYLMRSARPGLVVGVSQADGSFCLPDDRPDRLLLICGGSGITPVLAMLRTLCDEDYRGEVVFLHYASSAAHVPMRNELRAIAQRCPNLRVVLGYPETDDGDVRGYFGEQHLADVAPWYRDAHAYVCGPPGLMRTVREHYKQHDLLDRLHAEEFAPSLVAVPDDASGRVTFVATETTVDNTGATLLEQAEAAGLNPEYGCRMGICFSCTQVKTSGCTRNVRTGELNSDPDTDVQLCINVPVGDVAINI